MAEPDANGVDIVEVTEVTDELVEAWGKLMPQLSTSATAPSREWLQQIVDSTSTMFMAKADGKFVGSLTLAFIDIPVGRRAWIEDVVVDETMRGRRIGEQLSRAAIEKSHAEGVRDIKLTSSTSREAANRLYQRLGFVRRDSNVYKYKKSEA